MVKIRLTRIGSKKQASYRIIVCDSRLKRDGKSIEVLGYYNPRTQPSTEVVNEERALYWLSVGAQPSEGISSIFKRLGTTDRFQRLRAGEPIEALVAEATANVKPLPDQRTEYPAPAAGQSWVKQREANKQSN
jgi:small subunit ribosomal protein S16